MSLKSLNDILDVLEKQAQWQEQPFQRLVKFWPELVGPVVAAHTRPLSIQRDVLWVATSSAAWAQNLTFSRSSLLLKLNQKLPAPLVDIRFSTAGWQQPSAENKQQQTTLPDEHPSYVGDRISSGNTKPSSQDANAAFEDWAKMVQGRSHGLPLCPQCQSPTPSGELQRWGVCSICAAKKF
ncbi:MAG: DciA family protein [Nostoc sp. ChiSLP02]|nr:DciA family protein [Nostoc sp. DedSLP05]MDZ8103685.1 DciA family protein [Nostoc sp. DedSLP01]MDZ8184260.1 DciA family protein [Nostoc sp. ChiSLP02]